MSSYLLEKWLKENRLSEKDVNIHRDKKKAIEIPAKIFEK